MLNHNSYCPHSKIHLQIQMYNFVCTSSCVFSMCICTWKGACVCVSHKCVFISNVSIKSTLLLLYFVTPNQPDLGSMHPTMSSTWDMPKGHYQNSLRGNQRKDGNLGGEYRAPMSGLVSGIKCTSMAMACRHEWMNATYDCIIELMDWLCWALFQDAKNHLIDK